MIGNTRVRRKSLLLRFFGGRSAVNSVAAAKKAAGKSTLGSAEAEVEVEVEVPEMERCARPYDPVRDV